MRARFDTALGSPQPNGDIAQVDALRGQLLEAVFIVGRPRVACSLEHKFETSCGRPMFLDGRWPAHSRPEQFDAPGLELRPTPCGTPMTSTSTTVKQAARRYWPLGFACLGL